jgi:hypothetical protein
MINNKMKPIMMFLLLLSLVPMVFADSEIMGTDDLTNTNRGLIGDTAAKINLIFPAVLLIISIITVMIDFGAVGVILGSMGSLVIVVMLGIVALSWSSVISFIILGILLMFKVVS